MTTTEHEGILVQQWAHALWISNARQTKDNESFARIIIQKLRDNPFELSPWEARTASEYAGEIEFSEGKIDDIFLVIPDPPVEQSLPTVDEVMGLVRTYVVGGSREALKDALTRLHEAATKGTKDDE